MLKNRQCQVPKQLAGTKSGELTTSTFVPLNMLRRFKKILMCWIFPRWEKYDAKGWTEKGAHKYGSLNEQSWWEKWGENYDGGGSVFKW